MNSEKVDFTKHGKKVVHGQASSYNNHGCRCKDCKTAWAIYMKPRLPGYRKNRIAREQKAKQAVKIHL